MDLDEEFDKMYGDTGSAQEDADLDAEFEKAYGQEPSPVPAADDHSTHLPSKNGGEGEVVQMSHEKPGPRAVSTTGGNEEKVEQIAPNLFMKGNLLFDSENRTVKPGQFVVLSRKDGTSQLLSFNGANKNGKPVFEDVRGVSSLGADIAGRIDIGEDDFDTMLAGGKAKRSRSPLELVRLGLVAETGDEEKYAPGFVGTARAVVDRMLPYAGRHSRDLSMEQLKHLANIHEGKLDGYAGKNDDERLGVAAADAGLDYIRPGETREAYSMRIRAEADEMLKKRSKAKERAGAELGQTEASAFDKIVKGGVESGGYALEFALPGGVFGKAGQVLGMGRKALRVVSALGSAVPVVAAESRSRYVENTTPEYGVDEHGELERYAAPDSESEAAYKAIGGAALDTAVEIGLESATMGLLRLVGKPAGMALGKMTPRAVKDLGERTFNRFMASETGAALRSINRARQDFTSLTQINSPFGELMEENVQAFEKVLNLDGKTSEYKGFEKELKDYWDRQADWDTQWDIFYGLVAQLAIGAAKSTSDGLANRAATADARRDVRMALARSGISEGAINSLTTKQQKVLTEMWRRYSADPDALKDRAKNLGISMRAAVDELTSREGIDMARSLEQRGIAPEKFAVQVGADGKPAFHRMNRFASDGKSVPMNAMVDEGHGVTIVDQGDGTFYVMNDQRGFTARMADGFAAAKQLADNEVMDNQRRDADNEKKAQYLANLAQGMYTGRNIKVVPTEAALRWGLASAFKNGETPFGLVDASQVFDADGRLKQQGAGGFHTPDGTVVVILDNVASPSEMERVLAHEATGHEGVESNTGRGENTVKFIRNAKADGFERYKAGERARYVSALVRSGMGEEAANAVADEAMSTDSYQKEAMARYAQGRLHRPTWYERKKHEANEKRRADGESVPFDQADMEVMLAKAEEEGRSPGGKFDIGNADSGVRYFETGQEAADETGNVRNEAPAQPEQGSEGPAGGEAARPVEAQPQGGEINARQKILGTVKSISGDRVTVGYRDPWGKEQSDTFSRSEIVGVKPLPQTRENGLVSAPKEAGATTHLKAVATESSVKRRYTREPIAFSKPFVGRTGARLVGYEWPNEGEEYVDKSGNDRVRYISDWNYSEVNGETGRNIVHKFLVEMPDGERRTVSAESAAKLLGVSTSQVKGEGLKQIRKKMAVESLPYAQKAMFERITRNNKLLKDDDSVALMKDGTLRILGFRSKADGEYGRWNWHTTTISPDGSTKEKRLATKPGTKGFELDPADIVEGIRPTSAQTRGNAPAGAPQETAVTTQPRAAKPAEGRKSGDAAVAADGNAAEGAGAEDPDVAEKPENTTGGGSAADAGRDARKVVGTDYTVARARELLREDVEARIADAAEELGADLRVVGVDLHGSRVRGDARPDSDLDLVVEYEGDAREDDLFDALNADPIDFHGIRVDVNPIRADKTGTLAEYMARSDGYDREKLAAKPAPKPAAPAPKAPKTPSVRMKDEAAERKAKAALDAIDFDTPGDLSE